MYDKNGLNKEIEELKKKLEELEKASLNTAEKVLKEVPKKEEKEVLVSSCVNKKAEEVEETPSEVEPPKKGGLPYYVLPLCLLAIVVAIMAIFITMENSSKDRKMASQPDDVRGYSIVNDHRVWWDEALYQKNQEDKSQCFYYQPQGDYDPVPVCPATKMDIQKAKERGSYIDDPEMDFSDTAHIVAKPMTEEEKAEEAKSIDPVTLADANSTYISPDGKYKFYLKDGWIVEDIEGNQNIPFKGDAVIEFQGQIGEMVDTIESNTGQLVVGLSSWYQPDYTVVFKVNDPSSKMLMNLIKDQIAKDLDNEDLNGARIIFEESCGLFTTSAHSMGGHLYKGSWRREMVYLKTSTPLRILETRVDKWCKGDGGPSDECVRTKEYYIGK
nr:MAG TPA: hypothetical protein [Caudoviricetes sp.]